MNAIAVTASHWPNAHTLVLKRTLKFLNVTNMGLLAVTAPCMFTVFPLDIQAQGDIASSNVSSLILPTDTLALHLQSPCITPPLSAKVSWATGSAAPIRLRAQRQHGSSVSHGVLPVRLNKPQSLQG